MFTFNWKPAWSEPITSFIGRSLSQNFFCRGYDTLGQKTELLEQILQRCGRAKCAHADRLTFRPYIAFPSGGSGHFDGYPRRDVGRKYAFAVRGILLLEELPGRHAHDASVDAFGLERFIG